jgi:hypothetical protein
LKKIPDFHCPVAFIPDFSHPHEFSTRQLIAIDDHARLTRMQNGFASKLLLFPSNISELLQS